MKAAKILATLITFCLTFPISVYASYLLYVHVNATPMMWFLFIIQWPLTFIAVIINAITLAVADKK